MRRRRRRHRSSLLVAAIAALGLLYLVATNDSDRQIFGALAQYVEPPVTPPGPPGPPGPGGPPVTPPITPPVTPPVEPPVTPPVEPPVKDGEPEEEQGGPGQPGGPLGGRAVGAAAGNGCSLRQDAQIFSEFFGNQFQALGAPAIFHASGLPNPRTTDGDSCFALVMSGDQVVQGPGDPNGLARMEFILARTELTLASICHEVEWMKIGRPTSITIREGEVGEKRPEGEERPLVQKLIPNPDKPKTLRRQQVKQLETPLDDCVLDEFDEELHDELHVRPGEFHVEIATKKFPKGALRGQITPLDRAPALEDLATLLRTSDKGSYLTTDGKRPR